MNGTSAHNARRAGLPPPSAHQLATVREERRLAVELEARQRLEDDLARREPEYLFHARHELSTTDSLSVVAPALEAPAAAVSPTSDLAARIEMFESVKFLFQVATMDSRVTSRLAAAKRSRVARLLADDGEDTSIRPAAAVGPPLRSAGHAPKHPDTASVVVVPWIHFSAEEDVIDLPPAPASLDIQYREPSAAKQAAGLECLFKALRGWTRRTQRQPFWSQVRGYSWQTCATFTVNVRAAADQELSVYRRTHRARDTAAGGVPARDPPMPPIDQVLDQFRHTQPPVSLEMLSSMPGCSAAGRCLGATPVANLFRVSHAYGEAASPGANRHASSAGGAAAEIEPVGDAMRSLLSRQDRSAAGAVSSAGLLRRACDPPPAIMQSGNPADVASASDSDTDDDDGGGRRGALHQTDQRTAHRALADAADYAPRWTTAASRTAGTMPVAGRPAKPHSSTAERDYLRGFTHLLSMPEERG